MRPTRIISGGQTGADIAGLRAGKALGIETGGFCPRNCRTELGDKWTYIYTYGLTETPSREYKPRTFLNIQSSDVTLVFGEVQSPGSRLTVETLQRVGKPYRINPSLHDLQFWFAVTQIHDPVEGTFRNFRTVNVAGNRESSNRGIEAYVYRLLLEAWARDDQQELLKAAPWPDPLPKLTPP